MEYRALDAHESLLGLRATLLVNVHKFYNSVVNRPARQLEQRL
jgi:hypothetical protein